MADPTDQLHTLTEAAQLTGLTVDALRQRIRRRKLQAVRGNDGLIRVRIDKLAIEPRSASQPGESLHSRLGGPVQPGDQTDQRDHTIKALEDAAGELRDALAREQQRADTLEARENEARRELTAALVRAATAEGEAKALREALEEARRPFWRRLFGA